MKIVFPFLLGIFLLAGCNNSGYQFWNISKFRIVDSALKDGEEIKLLYTSQGPGDNKDLYYYIHIVVVSQKTGDTINILTPVDNGFSISDKDKVFNYMDRNSIVTQTMIVDYDTAADPNKLREAAQARLKKISKVARDPKYDEMADNNYPTVIGTIGVMTKPE